MQLKPYTLLYILFLVLPLGGRAQTDVQAAANSYFNTYTLSGYKPANAMRMDSVQIDDERCELHIYANESFCSQPFTPQSVNRIYSELQRRLPAPYNTYRLAVCNGKGQFIEDLVPNILRQDGQDETRLWGKINYAGQPWVENTSLPYKVTRGLRGRHLFIWPSHGRYYKNGTWQWQRPSLFCTNEDIFTQSFVFPYLFPMLEKAGAVVACPRERDYQTHEAVVDNDRPAQQGAYTENAQDDAAWQSSADSIGFAPLSGLLTDGVNPFRQGTYRFAPAVDRKVRLASATWTPNIPADGRYAVYVSYATRPNSVPDARYTVFHKGGRTTFTVNQQMGGGTWVYLGTFEFDKGQNTARRVVLTNQSDHRGVVTADGVRFGGGVGQTEREMAGTSGLPRYLEAARYYAQWAGVADTLVNTEGGANDYNDDLRVRSNMLNSLAAGSVYLPATADKPSGGRVPFELSLAVHSDAGYRTDKSIYGSLAISTTLDGDGRTEYPSGLSRRASSDFAQLLLNNLTADLSRSFGVAWTQREHWDRNYAETRMPNVPSAILETMSHQNYADMRFGHDPLFKFALARSVYKSILRFVNHEHGITSCTVQPLPPHAFVATLTEGGEVQLSWQAMPDTVEESAVPTGYVLYTKIGSEDFDNGLSVGNATNYRMTIQPGRIYTFKVTAVNAGGESFPSEQLSVYRSTKSNAPKVLVVNAFTRLSGPAFVDTPDSLGFRLDVDPGVSYLSTTAYCGEQQSFTRSASNGMGRSGQELVGKEIAGNTFNYPLEHGTAIAASDEYSFSSVSAEAFASPSLSLRGYAAVDYIAGLQGRKPWNLRPFPVFTTAARNKLADYLKGGGALLLSGSYIGSDNLDGAERSFAENVLRFKFDGSARIDSTGVVNGLNMQFPIYRQPNAVHYAAIDPDAIAPVGSTAFAAFAYGNGQSAGVAYKGRDYRTLSMGFPFECIRDAEVRQKAMKAMLDFLSK